MARQGVEKIMGNPDDQPGKSMTTDVRRQPGSLFDDGRGLDKTTKQPAKEKETEQVERESTGNEDKPKPEDTDSPSLVADSPFGSNHSLNGVMNVDGEGTKDALGVLSSLAVLVGG